MKYKIKVIPILLCLGLSSPKFTVFAQDTQVVNQNKEKTAIKGLDGAYIMDDGSGMRVNIVDKDGNKLIDMDFRQVDNKLSPGDTLVVRYPIGMADSSLMVLSEDLKVIVPENYYGGEPTFLESNGQIYIKVEQVIADDETHYYDLQGNRLEKEPPNAKVIMSSWAREEIYKAIDLNIVPKNLQSNYTNKITRQEFCQLAVQTYITKTGKNIDINVKSPFIDVNDPYITTAYNLKIVSGTSKDKFSPNNYITRQEAAVMCNNLAKILKVPFREDIEIEKFVDEKYFASWAKDDIYSICKYVDKPVGYPFIMTGTGDGKFSPWFNYTREQAIATMLRMYDI